MRVSWLNLITKHNYFIVVNRRHLPIRTNPPPVV